MDFRDDKINRITTALEKIAESLEAISRKRDYDTKVLDRTFHGRRADMSLRLPKDFIVTDTSGITGVTKKDIG